MKSIFLVVAVLATTFGGSGCCCCRGLFGARTETVVAAPACPAPVYAPAPSCPPPPCTTPYTVPPVTSGYAPTY